MKSRLAALAPAPLLAALLALPDGAAAQGFAEARLTWKLVLQASSAAEPDGSVALVKVRISTKELTELVRAEVGAPLAQAKLALSALRSLADQDGELLLDPVLIRADKQIHGAPLTIAAEIPLFPVSLAPLQADRSDDSVVVARESRSQQAVTIDVGAAGNDLDAQLLGDVEANAKRKGATLLFTKRRVHVTGSAQATLTDRKGVSRTVQGVVTGTISAGGEKLSEFVEP
jgi:hypothetical protein